MARTRESWITPTLDWKHEVAIFACRVSADDVGLVQLLAEDCITSPVLPKGHAKVLASVTQGIHGACSLLASGLGKKQETAGSFTLFLHDLLSLHDGKVLALVSPTPSVNASSPLHVSRKRIAGDHLREYQEKIEADRQSTDKLLANIRDRTDLSEEKKREYERAMEVGAALRPRPWPPRLSDLKIELEHVAFADPVPRTARARQTCVIEAVRSSGLGFPRSGNYDCTEIKRETQKQAAIIRWIPRGIPTPALEVKAALERRRKSAFLNPRLTSQHPPDLSPPEDSEPISRVAVTDKLEGLDQGSLSDMLPQPTTAGSDIVKAKGFEGIAWYQSFHRYDESVWGIYLNARSLDLVAASLALDLRKAGPRSRELAARLAVQLTLAHELFHARVDVAAAWIELGSRRRCYLPYNEKVYSAYRFTEEWREEALANWSANCWLVANLSSLRAQGLVQDSDAVIRAIENWLDFSPAGYRDWRQGDQHATWERLASELVAGKPHTNDGKSEALPIEGLLRAEELIDLRREDIPIYLVGRGVIGDALFSAPSRREVLRVLKHFGYWPLPRRGKGSHELWQGPDNRAFPVPLRDPLSVGVFHELLQHFGWSKKQYMQEIRAFV